MWVKVKKKVKKKNPAIYCRLMLSKLNHCLSEAARLQAEPKNATNKTYMENDSTKQLRLYVTWISMKRLRPSLIPSIFAHNLQLTRWSVITYQRQCPFKTEYVASNSVWINLPGHSGGLSVLIVLKLFQLFHGVVKIDWMFLFTPRVLYYSQRITDQDAYGWGQSEKSSEVCLSVDNTQLVMLNIILTIRTRTSTMLNCARNTKDCLWFFLMQTYPVKLSDSCRKYVFDLMNRRRPCSQDHALYVKTGQLPDIFKFPKFPLVGTGFILAFIGE